MAASIDLIFNKRPSTISTVLLALFGWSRRFDAEKPFPKITAQWKGVTVEKKHLYKFNRLCGIHDSAQLPLIYPFTLIYPLLQRILAHKEAPLTIFRTLNSRIQVLQHRRIGIDEILDIRCELVRHRIREKGIEIDIASVIEAAGEPVWENIQTYYYRGKFGVADAAYEPPEFEPIPEADVVAAWGLPAGIGLCFAAVSGDGNGIHYSKMYARMFGFERDFAQPLLVLAGSVERLLNTDYDNAVSLDVVLKGQFYYERTIILKKTFIKDATRFDIYCEGNPRSCIDGKLRMFEHAAGQVHLR
ncbi:MAG: hypothetical protein NTW12_03950 [Deltaproteobacteria bacterium]|nr:hypothetical protein [Deltaproteobacteria bacterium]